MRTIILIVLLATVFATEQGRCSWDMVYGSPRNELTKFACSDGKNGLIT